MARGIAAIRGACDGSDQASRGQIQIGAGLTERTSRTHGLRAEDRAGAERVAAGPGETATAAAEPGQLHSKATHVGVGGGPGCCDPSRARGSRETLTGGRGCDP
jgi:hypothetical protein